MIRRAFCLTTALVTALPVTAAAQDAHYWTYGYGPIGQLTEGLLVGGVSDLSAVYYNPAACALMKQPRFVLSLNSVELASIDVPGAAGEGLDFDQMIFDVVPGMVAGHIGEHDASSSHFAFALLARHDSDFDLGYNATRVSSASPDAAAGFGRFRQRLVEYWVGGSWSRRLSDDVSIGLSPFFAYRAQRSRRALTVEELASGVSRAAFVARENEYKHVRVLAKAGLAWRPDGWELGATLTGPGVALWGRGKTIFNASVSGSATPVLAASTQKGLEATYRAPWSIAGGATRRFGTTALHTTLEWFSSVAGYDILQPDPAPIAGRAESVPLTYRGEARGVVNLGAALEQRLGERLVFYGGVARNHSAYVAERDAFSAWDLTDVTAGFTFDRRRSRLALGIGYAWGSSELPQVIAPPDAPTPPPLREASFSRWTISFGASFGID